MTDPDQPTEPPVQQPYPTQPYPAPYPTQSYPAQSYPPPYQHYPPPQPVYAVPPPYQRRPVSATGPAAFAFGVMALLLGWVPVLGIVGLACGVVGVVFALKALELAKLGVVSDRGLAVAGMVLACAGIAVCVIVNVVLLVVVSAG